MEKGKGGGRKEKKKNHEKVLTSIILGFLLNLPDIGVLPREICFSLCPPITSMTSYVLKVLRKRRNRVQTLPRCLAGTKSADKIPFSVDFHAILYRHIITPVMFTYEENIRIDEFRNIECKYTFSNLTNRTIN